MTSGRSTLLAAAALPLSLAVTIGSTSARRTRRWRCSTARPSSCPTGAASWNAVRRGDTAGGVLVGADALEQAASNSANTVTAAKRFMAGPSMVGEDAARVGVAVGAADGGGAAFAVAAAAPVTPEEVGAQVLLELLRDVEAFAGEQASRAVLAVPAYFDDEQRAATLTAAALAGLDEVTLLAEPVAACVAHGLSGATGRVLVFDLGAGTFDVSVVSLGADGDVEVIATSGDARLGGNDFDAALVQWLGDEFARAAPATTATPRGSGGSPRRRRQQRCGSPSSSRSTSSRKASPTARRWRSRARSSRCCASPCCSGCARRSTRWR